MSLLPSPSRLLLPLLLLAPLACGGSVEVSSGGTGGAGGAPGTTGNTSTTGGSMTTTGSAMSSTTSTANTTVTTGTGSSCGVLGSAYEMALTDAAKCNGCKNFDGCVNGPVFKDLCGCPFGVDGSQAAEVQKAKEAEQAWLSAGCGPVPCGKPCIAPGGSWHCELLGAGTCDGTCSP